MSRTVRPGLSHKKNKENDMDMAITTISKKIGRLIVFGVPVIVGAGIVYHFTHSIPAVVVYEVALAFTALGFVSK